MNYLKPHGSYVCATRCRVLPAKFVCKVWNYNNADIEIFGSLHLPGIEPRSPGNLALTSVQRVLTYPGCPWGSAKFLNPCLRSRPNTKIITSLVFILRSWPARIGSMFAWRGARHCMLSHVTSCRLLGKVRRLGGCYGNCRVQPLLYCDGVPCRLILKQAIETHARDCFLWI